LTYECFHFYTLCILLLAKKQRYLLVLDLANWLKNKTNILIYLQVLWTCAREKLDHKRAESLPVLWCCKQECQFFLYGGCNSILLRAVSVVRCFPQELVFWFIRWTQRANTKWESTSYTSPLFRVKLTPFLIFFVTFIPVSSCFWIYFLFIPFSSTYLISRFHATHFLIYITTIFFVFYLNFFYSLFPLSLFLRLLLLVIVIYCYFQGTYINFLLSEIQLSERNTKQRASCIEASKDKLC
jgi:hypothetical protein